jgi:hypothetical protein
MELVPVQPLQQSENLEKLFEALSKSQSVMKPAVLDMTNPHFKSRYASLTSVHESCKGPLSDNGLSIIQQVFSSESGYYIRTMVGHSSGQWMANVFKLIVGRQDMQALGSAITYARRYGLSALIGIVDTEDDDANAAMPEIKKEIVRPMPPPREVPAPVPSAPTPQQKGSLSEKQLNRYFAIAKGAGYPPAMARAVVVGLCGKGLSECSRQDYDKVCEYVQKTKYSESVKAQFEGFVEGVAINAVSQMQKIVADNNAPMPDSEFSPELRHDELPF